MDATIRLWDPTTGRETAQLRGHKRNLSDLSISLAVLPDGLLASGSYDGTIRLWDPVSDENTIQLQGHDRAVTALAVLPDRL